MKRICLLWWILGVIPLAAQDARRPNVVIIVSDDQGWGDLSIHGNTNLNTPNIDGLARGGASFTNFYVSPVCSPTRAELLTGRYHPRGGVHSTSAGGERLDLDEQTLAEVFRSAGYSTAAYGKWHNGMQYPYHPNARGFDDFYGFCSGHWGEYFDALLEHNGKPVRGEGFIADDLTNKAIAFMEENRDTAFLLYLPYNTPHSPMQVPDRWWDRVRDREISLRHGEEEDVDFTRAALAMCENIDWNVGRVLDKLRDLRLEENTIVLYMSDNGPNSWRWNGGMKGRKGSTDEGGVHSPLFIQWKGTIDPGKQIFQITGAIDLLPTLADLVGIDYAPKKPLDGISLGPLLVGEQTPWPDRMLFSHWNGNVSVRTQRYRLDHQGMLFDIGRDPGQRQNVAGQMGPVAETLLNEVNRWRQEVLSELPKEDERPFILGHPQAEYTQIPAADGIAHGNVKRSNRFPNSSFFTNWLAVTDSVTWAVEVPEDGDVEVTLYYTCPAKDVGSDIELVFRNSRLRGKIIHGFDPPLRGMEHDRVPRMESYVKDFKALTLGVIHLEKGRGQLTLKALNVPGAQVMDFGMLLFRRMPVTAPQQ